MNVVADLENKDEYPSLLEQSPENSPQTKPKRQYYNQAAFYDEEEENDDEGWEKFDMESDNMQGYSKRNNSNDSTHVMVDEEDNAGHSTFAVGTTRGNRNNNKKNNEYNIVVMKEKEKKDNNSKELNFTDEEDEEPLMKTK